MKFREEVFSATQGDGCSNRPYEYSCLCINTSVTTSLVEEVDVEDATKRGRRGEEGQTARSGQPERRSEEEHSGREEPGKEDFIEKAKRKLQGR